MDTSSNIETFSKKARIRKLADGRFVAEEKVFERCNFRWKGIDLVNPSFLHTKESVCFIDCIGTRDQCLKVLAERGW